MRLALYQRWSQGLFRDGQPASHRKTDAANRLMAEGAIEIFHKPKFELGRSPKFFCIGSCFAREIESALVLNNLSVLSTQIEPERWGLLPEDFPNHNYPPVGILTKFNTFSMLDDLQRVLKNAYRDMSDFVELDGAFWDASLHNMPPSSLDKALAVRAMVDAVNDGARSSEVFIITLGLTEMWWDMQRNRALNDAPRDPRLMGEMRRFKFVNAGFDEVKRNIQQIVDLLFKISPTCKIILSVSPVPLHRTFSDKDIIVANCYSKSTLRAAAQEISDSNDNIDYFPSYEIVMSSPRDVAWENDQRHVRRGLVRKITDSFIAGYVV